MHGWLCVHHHRYTHVPFAHAYNQPSFLYFNYTETFCEHFCEKKDSTLVGQTLLYKGSEPPSCTTFRQPTIPFQENIKMLKQ